MDTYSAEIVLVRAPELASRLKRQIGLSELKLRQLAAKSGVDKSTISLWTQESDGEARAVHVESVRAVARVLGVDVEYLLDLPYLETEQKSDYEELLRRMAALWARAEELEDPTAGLSQVLRENLEQFGRLSALLQELRDLTAEARRVTGK